jgi:hypothetical protein
VEKGSEKRNTDHNSSARRQIYSLTCREEDFEKDEKSYERVHRDGKADGWSSASNDVQNLVNSLAIISPSYSTCRRICDCLDGEYFDNRLIYFCIVMACLFSFFFALLLVVYFRCHKGH